MYQKIISDLIVGIVGGLVATSITLFFRLYWLKVILPWLEERVYQDARIEGEWNTEIIYNTGKTDHFIITLHRKSHQVQGEMVSTTSGKRYLLKGEFRNLILTLTYSSNMPSAFDRGCFTLLLTNNGRELNGASSFYFSPESRIVSADVRLIRTDRLLVSQASALQSSSSQ